MHAGERRDAVCCYARIPLVRVFIGVCFCRIFFLCSAGTAHLVLRAILAARRDRLDLRHIGMPIDMFRFLMPAPIKGTDIDEQHFTGIAAGTCFVAQLHPVRKPRNLVLVSRSADRTTISFIARRHAGRIDTLGRLLGIRMLRRSSLLRRTSLTGTQLVRAYRRRIPRMPKRSYFFLVRCTADRTEIHFLSGRFTSRCNTLFC